METRQKKRHIDELKTNGITFIENYLSEEECEELYGQIDSVIDSDEFSDGDDYGGYNEMATADEPVLNERTGTDEGMIDIFNLDLAISEIDDIKNDPDINDIVNEAARAAYYPKTINTYVRRSVSNPAPFHADSYLPTFKTFLYLTDVPDTSYGPFSYVEGSHDPSFVEKFGTILINRAKGNTGAPRGIVPDPSEAVRATAPKGTLILSNQAGYHKAHPQDDGKERVLLTTAYFPEKEKFDFVARPANKLGRLLAD